MRQIKYLGLCSKGRRRSARKLWCIRKLSSLDQSGIKWVKTLSLRPFPLKYINNLGALFLLVLRNFSIRGHIAAGIGFEISMLGCRYEMNKCDTVYSHGIRILSFYANDVLAHYHTVGYTTPRGWLKSYSWFCVNTRSSQFWVRHYNRD